ncbi:MULTISPECIES: hypoxanthine phosphoribosyltransferase [Corallincola]|uniref:Hypoxanthine phosphoribosyltransferase n=2 Tax=Corallincola TaxID=1775176 RepID=A0ABY1WMD4_9GAMM|nr:MULTISPECIES: hypoxanthine phosphoribosyltransferase [Corallincola]TAA43583.1 hypoxanthine phosphoribosyltransferase [Corallincola spongiicola]TCI02835.1 hypoxanthine phosphoribosyltransferase [Corallincola luteus]
MKHRVDTLYSQEILAETVARLGNEISLGYQGTDQLLMIGLLKGSVIFLSDLCRQVNSSVELDFMVVSSYGHRMQSSGDVRILKDIEVDIKGREVLIVEDIIDSGFTLSKVREMLLLREPKSLRICTLLNKVSRREVDVPVDYVGFEIPDAFVVGYGIDWAEKYRNLPYIGKVTIEES